MELHTAVLLYRCVSADGDVLGARAACWIGRLLGAERIEVQYYSVGRGTNGESMAVYCTAVPFVSFHPLC